MEKPICVSAIQTTKFLDGVQISQPMPVNPDESVTLSPETWLFTSIKLITVATPETEATAFSAASFWIECSTTPSNFTTEFFTLTLSVSLPFSVGTPWSTFQTASDNLWSRVNAG